MAAWLRGLSVEAREGSAGKPCLAGCVAGHTAASSRNLLANPFNCNCQLAWLGDWLRRRKIVTGNPRCQNPDFLRQIPLQDVAFPDFRCEEGKLWAPGQEGRGGLAALERRAPVCWWGEQGDPPLHPAPTPAWQRLRGILKTKICLLF